MADQTAIEDGDVYWEMKWGIAHPDKPPVEIIFNEGMALARLLAEDTIFLNSHWWEDEWPGRAKRVISLNVNCNDIFAWGCADAEEVMYDELQALYDMWLKDPVWGTAKWCAVKRNQKPQPPIIKAMKAAGSWDAQMETLGSNYQDAEVAAAVAAASGKGEK